MSIVRVRRTSATIVSRMSPLRIRSLVSGSRTKKNARGRKTVSPFKSITDSPGAVSCSVCSITASPSRASLRCNPPTTKINTASATAIAAARSIVKNSGKIVTAVRG